MLAEIKKFFTRRKQLTFEPEPPRPKLSRCHRCGRWYSDKKPHVKCEIRYTAGWNKGWKWEKKNGKRYYYKPEPLMLSDLGGKLWKIIYEIWINQRREESKKALESAGLSTAFFDEWNV